MARYRDGLYADRTAFLNQFKTDLEAEGWVLREGSGSDPIDWWFTSTGENGSEAIFIRIVDDDVDEIHFKAYQWFSTADPSGTAQHEITHVLTVNRPDFLCYYRIDKNAFVISEKKDDYTSNLQIYVGLLD